MHKFITVIAPILLVLSACASNVHVDYETQYNFSNYQRFALQPHQVDDKETYEAFGGDIFEARLYRAINDNLKSKGLEPSNTPHFYIAYSLSKQIRSQVSYSRPRSLLRFWRYGPHHYYDPYDHYQLSDIRQYPVGRLTLKVIDAKSNKTVWASNSQTILRTGKTPADAEAALHERLTTMLAGFPPNNVLTL